MQFQHFGPSPSPAEIGRTGEAAAVQALRERGWSIQTWNTATPGATDIIAAGLAQTIRVQVKTALNGDAAAPSATEITLLRLSALLDGHTPYICFVRLTRFLGRLAVAAMHWRKIE